MDLGAKTEQEPQVQKWLREIEGSLNKLEETISGLIERTTSVAFAEPEVSATLKEVPPEMLVPLAERLRTLSKRIGRGSAAM